MNKYLATLVVIAIIGFGITGLVFAQTNSDVGTLENLVTQLRGAIANLGKLQGAAVVATQGAVVPGTCPGGATMPAGTKDQMIYCNGTKWVVSPDLIHNGSQFGMKSFVSSGNGFVCVDASGFLFRSATTCDVNGGFVTMSNPSAIARSHSSLEYIGLVTMSFTLTSKGQAAYVSKTPDTALDWKTTAYQGANFDSVSANSCSYCGDSSTYFVVPDGVSRTFTYSGTMDNKDGTMGVKNMKITSIFYDDDTSGFQEFNIQNGLSGLSVDIFLDNTDRN